MRIGPRNSVKEGAKTFMHLCLEIKKIELGLSSTNNDTCCVGKVRRRQHTASVRSILVLNFLGVGRLGNLMRNELMH